mmetsp:Transcript_17245/g.42786  ORF Transcript_17245/g.42786 Transcript_17245/m.42786 type:complete len:385 (+) Transcript_17245:1926-3080(+)
MVSVKIPFFLSFFSFLSASSDGRSPSPAWSNPAPSAPCSAVSASCACATSAELYSVLRTWPANWPSCSSNIFACSSVYGTQSSIVSGCPHIGSVALNWSQSESACRSKTWPYGVFTGSVMKAPDSWHNPSAPDSGTISCPSGAFSAPAPPSSSSSVSDSSSESIMPSFSFFLTHCRPYLPRFLVRFPFLRHLLLPRPSSPSSSVPLPIPPAPPSAMSATSPNKNGINCIAFTFALDSGSEWPPPLSTTFLYSRACFTSSSCANAFSTTATSSSLNRAFDTSAFTRILNTSSMCGTLLGTSGASKTRSRKSVSRKCCRKTLMLNVITTKVCSVAFRFWYSIASSPSRVFSYKAGRMLSTYGNMMSWMMVDCVARCIRSFFWFSEQ